MKQHFNRSCKISGADLSGKGKRVLLCAVGIDKDAFSRSSISNFIRMKARKVGPISWKSSLIKD